MADGDEDEDGEREDDAEGVVDDDVLKPDADEADAHVELFGYGGRHGAVHASFAEAEFESEKEDDLPGRLNNDRDKKESSEKPTKKQEETQRLMVSPSTPIKGCT